jgi:hypothetical protein
VIREEAALLVDVDLVQPGGDCARVGHELRSHPLQDLCWEGAVEAAAERHLLGHELVCLAHGRVDDGLVAVPKRRGRGRRSHEREARVLPGTGHRDDDRCSVAAAALELELERLRHRPLSAANEAALDRIDRGAQLVEQLRVRPHGFFCHVWKEKRRGKGGREQNQSKSLDFFVIFHEFNYVSFHL